MSKDIVLHGFDGSTYVRTVRMLLAEKGADYDQVPVNVLEGEPRKPEHLERSIEQGRRVLETIMRIRGDSRFISGDERSLADFYLAPVCFDVSLVDDAPRVFDVPGFADWWDSVQQLDSYKATEPDLG